MNEEEQYIFISRNSYSEEQITIRDLFNELFLECEHGDEEHRKWLKNKFDNFLDERGL